jgi:hypothetical protein
VHLAAQQSLSSALKTVVVGVVALTASVVLGATAQAGAATTSTVLASAKSAIAKQRGAHVVFVARSGSSSTTEKIVADVGATVGTETLSEGKATLTLKLTPAYGYVKGNVSGLTTVFGLTAAEAKKAGTHWVSWKAGTSVYTDLKADLTLASVTALLPKVAATKLSRDVTPGGTQYVLTWTTAATSSAPKLSNTLRFSTGGTTLPVEETATASDGTQATTTISRWGKQVAVSAPSAASTIAYSKISG